MFWETLNTTPFHSSITASRSLPPAGIPATWNSTSFFWLSSYNRYLVNGLGYSWSFRGGATWSRSTCRWTSLPVTTFTPSAVPDARAITSIAESPCPVRRDRPRGWRTRNSAFAAPIRLILWAALHRSRPAPSAAPSHRAVGACRMPKAIPRASQSVGSSIGHTTARVNLTIPTSAAENRIPPSRGAAWGPERSPAGVATVRMSYQPC